MDTTQESRVWQPDVIENVDQSEIDLYFKFAQSACIPGGSNSKSMDEALHQLYIANGDLKLAIQQLLKPTTTRLDVIPQSQSIKIISRNWTREEIDQFERLISHHGKNFLKISLDMKSKSVAQCVDFYYLWKRSPMRNLSRLANRRYQQQHQQHIKQQQQLQRQLQQQQQQQQQKQLTHNDSTLGVQSIDANNNGVQIVLVPSTSDNTIFTCKVCGREFEKIKSRSAHMKRHKNGR